MIHNSFNLYLYSFRFGLKEEVPSNETLNYIGVALAFVSGIFYVFVKSDTSRKTLTVIVQDIDPSEFMSQQASFNDEESLISVPDVGGDFFDRLSVGKKRAVGIALACFSGIMYGECFSPVVYVGEQENNHQYLDYLFSFYTGILLTSVFYFVLYCVIKKNQPVVYSNLILPGFISGWMW
jgi:hypothetical protein